MYASDENLELRTFYLKHNLYELYFTTELILSYFMQYKMFYQDLCQVKCVPSFRFGGGNGGGFFGFPLPFPLTFSYSPELNLLGNGLESIGLLLFIAFSRSFKKALLWPLC